MRRCALLAIALATVTLAACGSNNHASAPQTEPGRSKSAAVREVESVDQLRTLFNAESEQPRLIVLASPT
jgi:predicted component of type VI protein secretion system